MEGSNCMSKRLKSLDECGNVSIADSKKVERILNEKARNSTTYNHNKKVLDEMNKSNLVQFEKKNAFILKVKAIIKFVVIVIICFFVLMLFNH